MGKVTIIVESDNVPTKLLYPAIKVLMPSELSIKRHIVIKKPDIRVYIVPGDEE